MMHARTGCRFRVGALAIGLMALGAATAANAATIFDAGDMHGQRVLPDIDGEPHTAGLALRLQLGQGGARLFKPLPFYTRERGGMGLVACGADCHDLGRIGAEGVGGDPEIASRWTGATLSWRGANGAMLRIHSSRLTPAILVETEAPSPSIRLFGGPPVGTWDDSKQTKRAETTVPKYITAPTRDGLRVFTAATLAELKPEQLTESWLLAWYGNSNAYPTPFRRGNEWTVKYLPTVDCPVLLSPGEGWEQIRLLPDGGGIEFGFRAAVGRVVLLPLLGERHPLTEPATALEEWDAPGHVKHMVQVSTSRRIGLDPDLPPTEGWASGLPEAVLAACRWWAERLAAFPIDMAESYEADVDRVTVTGRYTHIRVRPGGVTFAPLPPYVTLARRMGFPVETAEPSDPGYLSAYGPYAGVDGDAATYSVGGLARYLQGGPQAGGEAKEPAELRAAFLAQVDKALEAGVMAPWMPIVSTGPATWGIRVYAKDRGRLEFGIPGENLYFLAECLDLLDDARKATALELMREWYDAFPPDEVAHMPSMAGARRERYPVVAEAYQQGGKPFPHADKNFHLMLRIVPVESLYHLARYHEAVGDVPKAFPGEIAAPYIRQLDWASGGSFGWTNNYSGDKRLWTPQNDLTYGNGGVSDLNHFLAGMIGQVRLAEMLKDAPRAAEGRYLFAKAALARYALERFTEFLYTQRVLAPPADQRWLREERGRGLHTFRRAGAADDPLIVAAMNERGLYLHELETHLWRGGRLMPYLGLVPEIGRFLRDHARQRVSDYVNIVERSLPAWYTMMARAPTAGEQQSLYPTDSYQIFLAKAWVTGEDPDKLRTYADLPWVERGDWYYLHKLAEAIRTYRGTGRTVKP